MDDFLTSELTYFHYTSLAKDEAEGRSDDVYMTVEKPKLIYHQLRLLFLKTLPN